MTVGAESQLLGRQSVDNPDLCQEQRRDLFFRSPRPVQPNTTMGLWCGDEKPGSTQKGWLRLFGARRGNRRRRTIWRAEAPFVIFLVIYFCWTLAAMTIADADAPLVSVKFGGGCPNTCSGHGYCTDPSTEKCSCHQGWAGGDCSIREYYFMYNIIIGCCRCRFGPVWDHFSVKAKSILDIINSVNSIFVILFSARVMPPCSALRFIN